MQRISFVSAVMMFFVSPILAQEGRPAGPKPSRVEVTPRVQGAEVGQQITFSAAGYDDAGNKMDAKASAWFAAPSDVAYSDDQGLVTFVLPGEVRVGAIINGKSGFIVVSVKPQPVARIEIKTPGAPIPVGAGVSVDAVTRTANGDPRTDIQVAWSSLNPATATVDESGLVTGVAPGAATIQAAVGDVKATAMVNIVRNPVRSLVIEPKTVKARTGDVVRFNTIAKDDRDARIPALAVRWAVSGDGAMV